MGVMFDARYGFLDERTGDVVRAKYIAVDPPTYRVWDLEGGVWEAVGKSEPRQQERVSLNRPFGVTFGTVPSLANSANYQHGSQVEAYRSAMLEPLSQQWTFKKVPRPPAPVVPSDDKGLANEFLLGCDPEAVAVKPTVTDLTPLPIEVPVRVSDYGVPFAGPVGYDHSGHVLELRPSPHRGSYALTKEIKTIINKNLLMCHLKEQGLRLRAGAFVSAPRRNITLGGHIHLGLPPNQKVTEALDCVTKYLEKLDVFPEKDCVLRRGSLYGHFGDVRTPEDSFGDLRTEYRTMPSWLYDPKVTYLALTTAKLAALDPDFTATKLKQRTWSWPKFQEWVEAFVPKDENAARLAEMLPIATRAEQEVFSAWEGPLGF